MKYGNLSNLSVGADDLGGPRAHAVRPYGDVFTDCLLGRTDNLESNR